MTCLLQDLGDWWVKSVKIILQPNVSEQDVLPVSKEKF